MSSYLNHILTSCFYFILGNTKGLIESALRILQHSTHLFLITEAANFLLACAHANTVNKSRISLRGGCAILSRRIYTQICKNTREDYVCAERCCMALASVLLYKSTHEAMFGKYAQHLHYLLMLSHHLIYISLYAL